MRRGGGFTLIELVVVVAIVALAFGVALDRLLRYLEMGERAALERNLAAINTALTMKFAAYVVSGQPQAIAAEVGKNPVELLARPPEHYLGELHAPQLDKLPRPSWHFDRASGELVYLPARRRYLASAEGPLEALRFRIALTAARDEPGAPRELAQPYLAATVPYTWSIE